MTVSFTIDDMKTDASTRAALVGAYRRFLQESGEIRSPAELCVTFESDDGMWVGGAAAAAQLDKWAKNLMRVRRAVIATLQAPMMFGLFDGAGEPDDAPLFDVTASPTEYLVCGAGLPAVRMDAHDAGAELERRKLLCPESLSAFANCIQPGDAARMQFDALLSAGVQTRKT